MIWARDDSDLELSRWFSRFWPVDTPRFFLSPVQIPMRVQYCGDRRIPRNGSETVLQLHALHEIETVGSIPTGIFTCQFIWSLRISTCTTLYHPIFGLSHLNCATSWLWKGLRSRGSPCMYRQPTMGTVGRYILKTPQSARDQRAQFPLLGHPFLAARPVPVWYHTMPQYPTIPSPIFREHSTTFMS